MTLFDRWFSGERLELNEATRAGLPGSFVRLSDGVTHYELGGSEEGPPVALVHGFSVPYFIWDPTFGALSDAGFRVLRYDLFGRGFSDRPERANTREFFARQFVELLDAQGMAGPVDVVSLSMGGAVAAELVQRAPERVRKLVFVDPAGFELGLPLAVRILKAPLAGEFLLGVLGLFGRRSLLTAMLSDFYRPTAEVSAAFVPRYVEAMQYRGFKRSLLSSFREGMLDEDLEPFRVVGESGKPVLLIWGREDITVPFAHSRTFLELVPAAEFHAIERAGHIPHFERPEVANSLLVEFLG